MSENLFSEDQEGDIVEEPANYKSFFFKILYVCSLISLIYAVVLFFEVYQFDSSEFTKTTKSDNFIFVPVMLAVALIMALLLLTFLVISFPESRTLTILFYIVSLVVLVADSSLFIFLLFRGEDFYTQNFTMKCFDDKSSIYQMDNQYRHASQVFCSPYCPCALNPEEYPIDLTKDNIYYSPNGAIRIQECEDYQIFGKNYAPFQGYAKYFEEHFSCSGMCYLNNYYVFSNVTDGVPKRSCVKAISDYLNKVSEPITIFSGVFCFVILINTTIMYLLQVWIPKLENAFYVKMTDMNIEQINNEISKRSIKGSSFKAMNKNTLDTVKKQNLKRSVGNLQKIQPQYQQSKFSKDQ